MKKTKFSIYLIISIILTLGVSLSLQSLLAVWTPPTAAPPGSNAFKPINVGDGTTNQTIDSPITISRSLDVVGGFSSDADTLKVDATNDNVTIGSGANPSDLTTTGDVVIHRSNPVITYQYSVVDDIGSHYYPRCSCDTDSTVDSCLFHFPATDSDAGICFDWYKYWWFSRSRVYQKQTINTPASNGKLTVENSINVAGNLSLSSGNISSIDSLSLQIDSDNNGANVFDIKDGISNILLRILENGNIGLNETNPTAQLTINMGVPTAEGLKISRTGNTAFSYLNIEDENNNPIFKVHESGSVGIGDSSPDGGLKLDVEGKVGATEYCDENGGNCVLASNFIPTCTNGQILQHNGTDWVCINGCEVNLTADSDNCGVCGKVCGANQVCQNSVCVCDTGYVDCAGGNCDKVVRSVEKIVDIDCSGNTSSCSTGGISLMNYLDIPFVNPNAYKIDNIVISWRFKFIYQYINSVRKMHLNDIETSQSFYPINNTNGKSVITGVDYSNDGSHDHEFTIKGGAGGWDNNSISVSKIKINYDEVSKIMCISQQSLQK